MKICSLIKDLLPLYHDGVLSEESKRAVAEHLEDCADCRAEYEKQFGADGALEAVFDEEEQRRIAESYREVKKRNRKRLIRTAVISALIAGALGALAMFVIKVRNTLPVYPQPMTTVKTVQELSEALEADGLDLLIPDPALLHTEGYYECAIELDNRTRKAKATGYSINGRSEERDYRWTVSAIPQQGGWTPADETVNDTAIGKAEFWGDPPEDEPSAGKSYTVLNTP